MNSLEVNLSIGFQCTTAAVLKKLNKRTNSFPFDWILSNPSSVLCLIKNLMDCEDIDEFVKREFLNIDKFVKFIKPEEFIIVESQTQNLLNSKYKFIFPHENSNYNEVVEKYKRRFIRLKETILNKDIKMNIYFIDRLGNNNNFKINNFNILNNEEDSLNNLVSYMNNIRENNKFYFILHKDSSININKLIKNSYVNCIQIESKNHMLTDEEIINNL
jgi:hypothetical protein